MPRLAGVDIPERKKVLYSLQYIHGIGPRFAAEICEQTGIDPDRKALELNDGDAGTYNNLGVIYMNRGKESQARNDKQTASRNISGLTLRPQPESLDWLCSAARSMA